MPVSFSGYLGRIRIIVDVEVRNRFTTDLLERIVYGGGSSAVKPMLTIHLNGTCVLFHRLSAHSGEHPPPSVWAQGRHTRNPRQRRLFAANSF